MLKVRVLCSVRRSNSAHTSYSLWSLGLLTLWRRPRSRWGFYHLWNSRSHPQTCRCNTIQVSLPLGDFYFEIFENAKLEMKSFLGSVCVGVCGVCVCTCLCVAATHCSMSASLSTNTSMSKLSFFPSTTETHKHTDVTDSALSPNIALQTAVLCLLTLLGVGVGLDLEDDSGNGVSVHVIERIGDPLRKQIKKKHLLTSMMAKWNRN